MNTPTDLLIKQLDPTIDLCSCCEEWKDRKKFDIIQIRAFVHNWHRFCYDCLHKIQFINSNANYLKEEILYYEKRYLNRDNYISRNDYGGPYTNDELIYFSLRYYKALVQNYQSFNLMVESRKFNEEIKLQHELYKPPKPLIIMGGQQNI